MRRKIEISRIERSDRLRLVNRSWAQAMAEAIAAGDRLPSIEVVERDGGFRLIDGAHRTSAHEIAGLTEIEAEVYSVAEFSDEASIRLREIKTNMMRNEMTALERAVAIAAWKDLHEACFEPPKKGRKPKKLDDAKLLQNSAAFSARFSVTAAAALRISERSVFLAVQVANGIGLEIRERIHEAPIADTMSELLQLSHQAPDRQAKIVDLLLSEPPRAGSVAEAVAVLDVTPAPAKLAGWERVSDKFSRLSMVDQDRFFGAHADAIDRWLMARGRRAA